MVSYKDFLAFWGQADQALLNDGLDPFVAAFGGQSFGGGAYAVLPADQRVSWKQRLASLFSSFENLGEPFSHDWLGRVFAWDRHEGEEVVRLCDPCTGDVFKIPMTLAQFHNDEMTGYADELLELAKFQAWTQQHGPLQVGTCVGYCLPLVLGGADADDNREVSDVAVYWDVLNNITQQVRGGGW